MPSCISPLSVQHGFERHVVPCGKCNFCLENRRNDWVFRLRVEQKKSVNSQFVTLTYADSNLYYSTGGVPSLSKADLQLFWKRLRKLQQTVSSEKIRYFICGEYGSKTLRPHYHAILFNCKLDLMQIQSCWGKGHAHTGSVTSSSIRYVTKYIINKFDQDIGDALPPFTLMSRRPGIGNTYVLTHKRYHKNLKECSARVDGKPARLPRYLKEKIFDKWELKRFSISNKRKAEEKYNDLINRMALVHDDPHLYVESMLVQAHDRISTNAKNKQKI